MGVNVSGSESCQEENSDQRRDQRSRSVCWETPRWSMPSRSSSVRVEEKPAGAGKRDSPAAM